MLKIQFIGEKGQRLDQFLLENMRQQPAFKNITRSQLKQIISCGNVKINSKCISKAGYALRPGDEIELEIDRQFLRSSAEIIPYDVALDVIYEDEFLLAVNKPAGLTVHPGAGNKDKTLLNALLSHLGKNHKFISQQSKLFGNRPGIVHRLDKDTSGVILLAKDAATHQLLAKQFAKREVSKFYLALAYTPQKSSSVLRLQDEGTIDLAIARHPKLRTRMAISKTGKSAITNWKIIKRGKEASLVLLRPQTGRTHQIRVHMQHLKAPLIGDERYKDNLALSKEMQKVAANFGHHSLHALKLELIHPHTLKKISFIAKWPDDFKQLMAEFGIKTKFEEITANI